MKYKVLLYDGSGQGPGSFAFYTSAQAIACAQNWQQAIGKTAYLWDGVQWNAFIPVP